MPKSVSYAQIEKMEQNLKSLKLDYLTQRGWKPSMDNPARRLLWETGIYCDCTLETAILIQNAHDQIHHWDASESVRDDGAHGQPCLDDDYIPYISTKEPSNGEDCNISQDNSTGPCTSTGASKNP